MFNESEKKEHKAEIVNKNEQEGGYLVPAAPTIRTLETLSNELYGCTTILEAKRVADVAHAVQAWTSTQRAAQALHRDATVICTRAERRLGELAIAMRPTPGQSNAGDVLRARRDELKRAGLNKPRVQRAELLAIVPKGDFEEALRDLDSPTPNAVLKALGQKSPLTSSGAKFPSQWRELAQDAIAILSLTVKDLDEDIKNNDSLRARVKATRQSLKAQFNVLRGRAVDLNTRAKE